MSWLNSLGIGGGVKLHDDYGKQVSDEEMASRLAAANYPDLYNGSGEDKEWALQATREQLNSRPAAVSNGLKAGETFHARAGRKDAATLGAEAGAEAGAKAAGQPGSPAMAEKSPDITSKINNINTAGGESGGGGLGGLASALGKMFGDGGGSSTPRPSVQPNVTVTPQTVSFEWQRRGPSVLPSGRTRDEGY